MGLFKNGRHVETPGERKARNDKEQQQVKQQAQARTRARQQAEISRLEREAREKSIRRRSGQ